MATRTAMRYVARRFSSSGKVLSEEEKAAENVYIKVMLKDELNEFTARDDKVKTEQEKLEKLARKGPKPEETAASSGGSGSVSDAKPKVESTSAPGVSTDKYRNYAVVAGLVTILGASGWYFLSKDKKPEEVQD